MNREIISALFLSAFLYTLAVTREAVLKKLESIQVLRAAAALIVVLYHAHAYLLPAKIAPGASFFRGLNMGYAGVELFFVISGFIIWTVHRADIGNRHRAPAFLYKRVTRVYPVYWLILFGLVALYVVMPGSGPENARNLTHILLSATLLPLPFTPVMAVAWTLQHEMFFYALFALLILSPRGKWVLYAWGAACASNVVFDMQLFPFSFFFSPYNLLFFLGMGAAYGVPRTDVRIGAAAGILGVIIFLAVGLSEAYGLIAWYKPLRTLLFGLGAALMMGFACLENARCPKPLVAVGDGSYSLYLIHMPCMLIASALIDRVGVRLPAPAEFAFLIVLAVASSMVFYLIIEKNLIGFLKKGVTFPPPLQPSTVRTAKTVNPQGP